MASQNFRPVCESVPRSVASVIHQDAPHQLSRDRKEVRAVLPLNVARVDQPQIGLIDQRRGLQRYAVSFAPALLSM